MNESVGIANHGYWEDTTRSERQACDNLLDRLFALAPDSAGSILEVACGRGETTRYLMKLYPAERVTAIDVSETRLETARAGLPGVTFRRMDATRLEFPDDTFDTVICVEAAYRFEPRSRFLQEALRVLKPGGRLLLADLLCERWTETTGGTAHPDEHARDPKDYETLLARAGFEPHRVVDATEESWVRSNRQILHKLCERYRRGRIDRSAFNRLMTDRLVRTMGTRYYVLVSATRPAQAAGRETDAAEETFPPVGEWLGPVPAPANGLTVLVERARLAGAERGMRLLCMARLEETWARMLRRDGDRGGARRHAQRALLYRDAARAPRRRRT